MSETFPVLWPCERDAIAELNRLGCPRSVPWSLVAPHERQAESTHDQSLKQLAERGGLSVDELLAVLTDRSWFKIDPSEKTPEAAVSAVLRLLAEHTRDDE